MNWNDQKDNRYIFTVSELNNSAKKTLENSFSDIWIKGEISNFKSYPSGHWYFTLKDEESQIQCVMFKFKNSLLNFIDTGFIITLGLLLFVSGIIMYPKKEKNTATIAI